MNENKNITLTKYKAELKEKILEVRYTDMEEEKRLCKELLDISEAEQYFYGSAFANVYLVDSHLALGEYSSCDFYLLRASFLCKEHGFDDLMLVLCNFAGLYYQKLNDDQTALSYFLEGEKLAAKLGDKGMVGKIYNNIGYSFARNDDLKTAREYFKRSFEAIENCLEGEHIRSAVTYLSNLSEACKYLNDSKGCKEALERCEELSEDDVYSRIRLGCSWCSYYVSIGDIENLSLIADRLINHDFEEVEDQFFVCDMAEGLCSNMLTVGDQERAKKLLDIIENIEYETSLYLQHKILCLQIQYWENFNEKSELDKAYKKYYEIIKKTDEIDDEIKTQSIVSKIQINQAMLEREIMMEETKELENVNQLDELTGIYNRRYFNKLVSKMAYRDDTNRLGFIMIDVDYFKQYNDFYGHFQGDGALRAVANALAKQATDGIYVSRYGGDEFICLCVNISDDELERYIKNVMEDIRDRKIEHKKHKSADVVTISVGYANEKFDENILTTELILDLADKALYEAKNSGRGVYARKSIIDK